MKRFCGSPAFIEELPEGVSFDGYHGQLKALLDKLDYIPIGAGHAGDYEEFVGNVIKLCFFRSLTNVQPKARDYKGVVIRDWVASNRAATGFWQLVREKYGATQVVWECKNYAELAAEDFQQLAYYLNDTSGRFIVCVYRANETDSSYYRHMDRIAKEGGLVLLLNEKDIRVFIRQALKGKTKEDHISEIFDRTVRSLS